MSTLAVGVAASHSTLMNTHWDATVHKDRAERFRSALAEARDAVAAADVQTVVVIGSNHFRGLWLDLMPAFTIGVGDVIASGESGTPEGPLKTDQPLARYLCDALVDGGFDLAFSGKLQVDHGITHAVQYVLADLDVAVIPLVVNMFAPPLPRLDRCAALGRALGGAIASAPGDGRVAIVASGGLSHALPWPDWRQPESDDDEFMVRAWLDGRENWSSYDTRRREIILKAKPRLNEEFDEQVLGWVEAGELERVIGLEGELAEIAGNGAHEVRSWLMMAAACGHAPGRRLVYSPMPEWMTGMAASIIAAPRPAAPRPVAAGTVTAGTAR